MTLNKSTFRQTCLQKMRSSPKHNRLYKEKLLNKKLLELLEKSKGKKILFYYPLKIEGDIRKTLIVMRRKREVYIPFMQGESFKMVPFRLPLKKKKFGIFEAGNTVRKISKIDTVIVPAVGVDGNLQRVGFGKGMYDRFFEKLQKKPYTIFTQLELCYTKEFICDSYDVKCDVLLTPTKVIKKI
ncbi:5-formyltetrahydrofolate cyclo-ligase [Sulfurimonas sp.]|jgi:5-formyltetrahydrofolate cyclo-ligase|uniref:5-formyltetrahydrofolate cyclo-ligase n=1 Tax=Sulfurimonas sp. TaxID=2022749 RepID=UPI0025EC3337|nr:5-formyltetrahydrofolate cyclo-ligase [Sulfurimonas sp.]MBT5934783.1 5-formyltetrahydrofolate cyclo-ligase [Sulfurimonas sp.]